LLALSLLVGVAAGDAQQSQSSETSGKAIPTFEALDHTPAPPGFFKNWCGLHDRILMEVGQEIGIYDGATRSSVFTGWPLTALQCSSDGQRVVFVDNLAAVVREVDIRSGADRVLASFEKDRLHYPVISASPDLRIVATDRSLHLSGDKGDLTIIDLTTPGGGRRVYRVKWNEDSSSFLTVSSVLDDQVIDVFDCEHRRVASGPVPRGFVFRDGWFSDGGQSLILYLGSSTDEFGLGFIFRCKLVGWKCERVLSDIAHASSGGGVFATVRGLDKPPAAAIEGGSQALPPRYVVEIRNNAMQVRVRNTYASVVRRHVEAAMAPSGKKVTLTWVSDKAKMCPRPRGAGLCETGIVVDLSGRLR